MGKHTVLVFKVKIANGQKLYVRETQKWPKTAKKGGQSCQGKRAVFSLTFWPPFWGVFGVFRCSKIPPKMGYFRGYPNNPYRPNMTRNTLFWAVFEKPQKSDFYVMIHRFKDLILQCGGNVWYPQGGPKSDPKTTILGGTWSVPKRVALAWPMISCCAHVKTGTHFWGSRDTPDGWFLRWSIDKSGVGRWSAGGVDPLILVILCKKWFMVK